MVTPTGTKGCTRHVALAAPFVPIGVTNRDKRVLFVPVARPGTKGHPLLSRSGVPGWETGTTEVSQPGQISFSVVVTLKFLLRSMVLVFNLSRRINHAKKNFRPGVHYFDLETKEKVGDLGVLAGV